MRGQRGFTLIELLIVVAIIGIIAAIIIPQVGVHRVKKDLAKGVTKYTKGELEYIKQVCENETFSEEGIATAKRTCAKLGFTPGEADPGTRAEREQQTYENSLVTKEQLDRVEAKMDNILKQLTVLEQRPLPTTPAPVQVAAPITPVKPGGVAW